MEITLISYSKIFKAKGYTSIMEIAYRSTASDFPYVAWLHFNLIIAIKTNNEVED